MLAGDPAVYRLHHVCLLGGVEGTPGGDAVPAREAFATAGGGGVLGDEHGVSAVGGLSSVVAGLRRGEPALDQLRRVSADGGHAAQGDRLALTTGEPEPRPETLLPDPAQPGIQLVHDDEDSDPVSVLEHAWMALCLCHRSRT